MSFDIKHGGLERRGVVGCHYGWDCQTENKSKTDNQAC